MTDYTAHVMVPDAVIGATFVDLVLDQYGVDCATLRCGAESWLSIGFSAEADDEAVIKVSGLRERIKNKTETSVRFPEGYASNALEMFQSSPMIVTHGRTVVYSEGV